MPELLIKHGNQSTETILITRSRVTLGRSVRNDICVPDPFASRVHAEIRKEGDNYWLQDLGSANGTRFKGEPLNSFVQLSDGTAFQIGETVLTFKDGAQKSVTRTFITEADEPLNPSTIALNAPNNSTAELIESLKNTKSGEYRQHIESSRSDLLALISKVGVTLLTADKLDETLNQVASLVFDAVPADRCVIMMRETASDEMTVAVARLRSNPNADIGEIRISHKVLEEVVKNGKSVLTADAQHDPRLASQTMALQGIRSVLAVPLRSQDEVFGIIYADSPVMSVNFSEEHLKVLTTLASVAAIRVENARLLEERLERERMERELQLASEIQQNFQPSAPPKIEGYELQGISFSCYEVGGDYYDFISRCDDKHLIALGDVSGKGTAAALLMSSLHASIHAQAAANHSVIDLVKDVNEYLAQNTPSNRFVTLFIAELEPHDGTLTYVNAGHNPPLLARADGTVIELESGGFPLGILPNVDYEVGQRKLEKGDFLLIYSDGVSETVNPAGDEFGTDRLVEVVRANLKATASSMRDKIDGALTKFADTAPAADDITLVIVKRQA